MPCGFKDPRRAGHRCTWCRRNHRKCDRQLPCSACKQRGIECQLPQSAKNYTFIALAKKTQCIPVPSLNMDRWKYTQSFFDAANSSRSPLMRIFCFEKLSRHVQHDHLINTLVCNLGRTFISDNQTPGIRSTHWIRSFSPVLKDIRQRFYTQLQSADSTHLESMMVAASLLIFLEVTAGNNGPSWCSLVLSVREKLLRQADHVSTTPYHQSLLSFLRIAEAVRSICFEEDMMALGPSTNFLDYNTSVIAEPSWTSGDQLEMLSKYMALWAKLEFRALQWIKRSEAENPAYADEETKLSFSMVKRSRSAMMPESVIDTHLLHSQAEHLLLGMDIIHFATKFQQAVVSTILSNTTCDSKNQNTNSSTNPGSQMLIPYYHWALTGISQLFRHPAWSTLDLGIPAMNYDLLHDQAMQAFRCAEEHANHPEAVLFLPIINVIALEMRTIDERKRIQLYVDVLRQKGFHIASAIERDLPTSWSK